MDLIQRFQEYADAFEIFYEKDDPSILEPFFTEDAVYETIAPPPFARKQEGRDTLLENLKRSVDTGQLHIVIGDILDAKLVKQ